MADIEKIYDLIGREKFEPQEVSTEDRIDAIEEVLLELVLGGGIND